MPRQRQRLGPRSHPLTSPLPPAPTSRAATPQQYNRRFVNVVVGLGKKRSPNSNAQ